MTVTVLPDVMQDMAESHYRQQVYIVAETQMHTAPWLFDDEGWDKSRLKAAIELVCTGKVLQTSAGWDVKGSAAIIYAIPGDTLACPCKAAQHSSKSSVCKHRVAVELARRVQQAYPQDTPLPFGPTTVDERLAQATPPADPFVLNLPDEGLVSVDATGHAVALGTLPLPPTTVEERLTQSGAAARDHVYDALPLPVDERLAQAGTVCETPDCTLPAVDLRAGYPVCEGHRAVIDARLAQRLALGAMHDSTALQTHHMPQEDRMADDAYIPEPDTDHVSTAILEPPATPAATPRPLPGPHLLPSLDARTLEQSMQAYAAQRAVVTRYIKEQMSEGVDYYTLTIKGRVSKATLSKAGSEKFLSLFQLSAQFQQDLATWQMLGAKEGLLCYTCTLMTRSGEVVGEGRGARSISQDGGDINKAIKMATKSAQVDAVLRTGALSDVFTQDLEPETPDPVKPAAPAKPTSQDLRQRIWELVKTLAPNVQSREDAEEFVRHTTGMILHPDNYPAILAKLREEVR